MDSEPRMASRRHAITFILLLAVTGLSFLSFGVVTEAIFTKTASVFVIPSISFFFLLAAFALGGLFWQERMYRIIGSVLLVFPSLFFTPTLIHTGIVFIGALAVFLALFRIEKELSERTRLSIHRGVLAGFSPIIFALTLIISSQYYNHANTLSWDELVPSFDLAEGTGAWLLRTASSLSPALATLQDKNLSVDSFLRELKPVVVTDSTLVFERGVAEVIRQKEIARSKSELSRLLGREIDGEENMNAVLSEVLRKKVVAFVTGRGTETPGAVPFLPFFLSLLLFFTVFPLGTILAAFALSLATLIFFILVKIGLVQVKKIPAEREVLI